MKCLDEFKKRYVDVLMYEIHGNSKILVNLLLISLIITGLKSLNSVKDLLNELVLAIGTNGINEG